MNQLVVPPESTDTSGLTGKEARLLESETSRKILVVTVAGSMKNSVPPTEDAIVNRELKELPLIDRFPLTVVVLPASNRTVLPPPVNVRLLKVISPVTVPVVVGEMDTVPPLASKVPPENVRLVLTVNMPAGDLKVPLLTRREPAMVMLPVAPSKVPPVMLQLLFTVKVLVVFVKVPPLTRREPVMVMLPEEPLKEPPEMSQLPPTVMVLVDFVNVPALRMRSPSNVIVVEPPVKVPVVPVAIVKSDARTRIVNVDWLNVPV
ncbi:MAG: hypothetical protein L6R28_12320 [Planctomycetes bacterium]|nr:hypothetical protein [Planctomycetota bacterium]